MTFHNFSKRGGSHLVKIVNENVFAYNWIPPELPGREKHLMQIRMFLSRSKGGTPSNIYITGPPGTGKTVTAKYLAKKFVNGIYIPPSRTLWSALSGILRGKTGTPTDRLINLLAKKVGSKFMVIIFDEIDRLIRNDDYAEAGLMKILDTVPAPLILISNDIMLENKLSAQFLDRLQAKIRYTPYTYEELARILKQRIQYGVLGKVEEEAILKLAIHIARTSGSAREAIDYLFFALRLAEERHAEILTVDIVDEVISWFTKLDIMTLIGSLTSQQRKVLYAVVRANSEGIYYLREIYNKYIGWDISYVTFWRRIKELEDLALVETTVVYRGRRHGTKTIVKHALEKEVAEELMKYPEVPIDIIIEDLKREKLSRAKTEKEQKEQTVEKERDRKETAIRPESIDWSGFVRLSTSHEDNYSLVKIIVTNSSVPAEYIVDVILSQVGPADSKLMVYVEYPLFKKTTIKIERKNGRFKVIVLSPKKREITTQKLKETLIEILSQLKN